MGIEYNFLDVMLVTLANIIDGLLAVLNVDLWNELEEREVVTDTQKAEIIVSTKGKDLNYCDLFIKTLTMIPASGDILRPAYCHADVQKRSYGADLVKWL